MKLSNPKWVMFAAPTVLAMALVAGCGGPSTESSQSGSSSSGSSTSAPETTAPSSTASTPAGSTTTASSSSASDEAKGKELFGKTCATCHGPKGEGMPGLGKDLITSKFVKSETTDKLVAFLKVGRPATDPLNTTKVDMPPRGGNPALTDDDLKDIAEYVRQMNKG